MILLVNVKVFRIFQQVFMMYVVLRQLVKDMPLQYLRQEVMFAYLCLSPDTVLDWSQNVLDWFPCTFVEGLHVLRPRTNPINVGWIWLKIENF